MAKEYGIIGKPLSHSFSPEYFANKFRALHLDHSYLPFELNTIQDVVQLVKDRPNLVGFNVTVPFKQDILPFLATLSDEARSIGAVNTVKVIDGKLHGYNTDVIGFDKTIAGLHLKNQKALVLGSGGASKAVRFVLNQRNIDVLQVSRITHENGIRYDEITSQILTDYPVIINTTPLGMEPDVKSKPNLPYSALDSNNVLVDLVYNPRLTAFLHEGLQRGSRIKNGFQMLVEQAEASWKIWESPI